jgi:hypothetical protein
MSEIEAEIQKMDFDRILPRDMLGPGRAPRPGMLEGLIDVRKMWPNGSNLKVRFMDGTAEQRDMAKEFATEWTQHANLTFEFGDAPDAEIRVSFAGRGNWSWVGTDSKQRPVHEATLNLSDVVGGTIRHEFGHAIGLVHEHSSPDGGIQWNKPLIYRELEGPPNFWSPEEVDWNVFFLYDRDHVRASEFDGDSIMIYTIPARWTLNGFSFGPNEVLSEMDKAFIASNKCYPAAEPVPPVGLLVADSAPTQAEIGQPGEEDLFQFEAGRAGRYVIETDGRTDVVMSLYGPDSKTAFLAQDDDSGADFNSKITVDLTPGTYYVQVRHYNRAHGTGSYGIHVSV